MGCLNQGILPPQVACTCPHDCIYIAAANLLPKEQTRLNPCLPLGALPVPSVLGTTPVETPLHSLPLTGAPLDHNAEDIPQRTHADLDRDKGIARPTPSAHLSGPHQQKLSSSAAALHMKTTQPCIRGHTRPIYTRQDQQRDKPIHAQGPLA